MPEHRETSHTPFRSLRPAVFSSPRVPELNTLVDGAYRVKQLLGRGGMGVVLLCEDERLEREVALKLVSPDYIREAGSRAKFMNEARAMAGVRHENVVNVFSFGEHEGQPYFAMEFVPGTTVADYAYRRAPGVPPAPVHEVVGILEQVCRGLGAIHASGMIHGDIKPGNILLAPSFRAVVTDFGLMRWAGEDENLAVVVGTPAYIPPEVVHADDSGLRLTPAADVYALGVAAFEMLTRRLPFPITNVDDLFRVHQERAVAPLVSSLRPDVPQEIDAVVARALASEMRARYASAEAMRRDLASAIAKVRYAERTLRIVVADDDDDFRPLVAAAVRAALPGSTVIETEDGAAAFAAIESAYTDLAIVDLKMPRMNGVELVMALRGSTASSAVPVVVVTAFGGATDWSLLSSLGAVGFLVKPFDPYSLVALVRSLVAPSGSATVRRVALAM